MSSLVIISTVTILVCLIHLAPPASTAPVLSDIPESTTVEVESTTKSTTVEVQFFGQEGCKGSEMVTKIRLETLPGKSETPCPFAGRQFQCAKLATPMKGYEVFIELFDSPGCRGNLTALLPLHLESNITVNYFKVVVRAIPNSLER